MFYAIYLHIFTVPFWRQFGINLAPGTQYGYKSQEEGTLCMKQGMRKKCSQTIVCRIRCLMFSLGQ